MLAVGAPRGCLAILCARRCLVTVAAPKHSEDRAVYDGNGVEKLLRIRDDLMTPNSALKSLPKTLRTKYIIEDLLGVLSRKDIGFEICSLMQEILKEMIRKEMYCEYSYDLLASTLKNTSNELVMQHIVPAFLGMCTKVRYYDPSLLNIAGCYAIDNVKNLSVPQLVSVIYSMGQFYHPFPALFSKLEKYLLADDTYLHARHLAWMVVWGGMIHDEYPKDLMGLMLQDSYIEGMIT